MRNYRVHYIKHLWSRTRQSISIVWQTIYNDARVFLWSGRQLQSLSWLFVVTEDSWSNQGLGLFTIHGNPIECTLRWCWRCCYYLLLLFKKDVRVVMLHFILLYVVSTCHFLTSGIPHPHVNIFTVGLYPQLSWCVHRRRCCINLTVVIRAIRQNDMNFYQQVPVLSWSRRWPILVIVYFPFDNPHRRCRLVDGDDTLLEIESIPCIRFRER